MPYESHAPRLEEDAETKWKEMAQQAQESVGAKHTLRALCTKVVQDHTQAA